ncbi:MAG: GFA family protein [Myxococcales bacterium]|nr:GFA family protein [Myxococcales bacterium]
MSESEKNHKGQCFCGAVQLTVQGDPVGAGYCHCEACRSWSAGPVNAFTLWKSDAVTITQGRELIGEYHKTDKSYRQWCTVCGGHLLTRHPQWDLIDVYAATIPDLPFTPGVHVNYAETVLPMNDGLPKLRDFPAELGGSGELLPG